MTRSEMEMVRDVAGRTLDAVAAIPLEAWLALAAVLLLGGAVVGLVRLARVVAARVAVLRARRRTGRRPRQARALIARGATRAEVARRTGLAQDAVALMLRGGAGEGKRPILPTTARIAA